MPSRILKSMFSRSSQEQAASAPKGASIKTSFLTKINFNLLAVFVPGICLLGFGLAALLMPRLMIALVAGFFVFAGTGFLVLAYKFIQLKNKIQAIAKNLEGRIVVQGMNVTDIHEVDNIEALNLTDHKKITFH